MNYRSSRFQKDQKEILNVLKVDSPTFTTNKALTGMFLKSNYKMHF